MTTLCTAVAALDPAERAGFANGARINAESHGPRGRRMWLALADLLDDPSSAADDALRAVVADMREAARQATAATFFRQRQVMAEEGRHVIGDVYSEIACLLAEVGDEQRATFENARHSFYSPCARPEMLGQ